MENSGNSTVVDSDTTAAEGNFGQFPFFFFTQHLSFLYSDWCLNFLKFYTIIGVLFFSTRHYHKLKLISWASEIIFCFLTFLFGTPFMLAGFLLNYMVRVMLSTYLRWRNSPSGNRLQLMSGNDAFWAYDEYANSCNFTNYLVMRGVCDIKGVRKRIYENMVTREDMYGKLGKRSVKTFGYYCWEELSNFDVNYHVDYLVPSAPFEPVGEDELFDELKKIIDYPLPRDRPQWQLLLVPHYVYKDPAKRNEQYWGLVVRMHHSYMDGISGGFIIQNAFADSPPKLAVNPLQSIRIPLGLQILSYLSMFILGPRSFFRTLLLQETNCFHGKALTGPKTLSWSRAISLDALKAVRIKTKTTTTAIFVSSIGSAIKKLALRKKLPLPKLIHGFQTVAMLPYPNLKPHNRFAVALLPMQLGLSSSIERLQCAYKAFKELEAVPDIFISFLTMKLAGLLPRLATKFISDLAHATILISNVPGPAESCKLFNGNELMELSAWAPIRCGIGMGVGFFSYNGKVRACFIADASCLPDPTDVSLVLREFEQEVIQLSLYSEVPAENIFV